MDEQTLLAMAINYGLRVTPDDHTIWHPSGKRFTNRQKLVIQSLERLNYRVQLAIPVKKNYEPTLELKETTIFNH